jgi:hypothetical protein
MKHSLISFWPVLCRNATRDILSFLNKKNYTKGLKTIGKWLSDKERQEENGIVKQLYS